MLDLVITRTSSNIVTTTDVCKSSISDHYSVTKPRSSSQMRQVRNFKRMDHASFEADLISELANVDTELGVEIVLRQYEKAMKSSINMRPRVVNENPGITMIYTMPGSCDA